MGSNGVVPKGEKHTPLQLGPNTQSGLGLGLGSHTGHRTAQLPQELGDGHRHVAGSVPVEDVHQLVHLRLGHRQAVDLQGGPMGGSGLGSPR